MVTFHLSGVTDKECFVSMEERDKKKYPWFQESLMPNCFLNKDKDRIIFYLTRMIRQKIKESILVKDESGTIVFYYEKL